MRTRTSIMQEINRAGRFAVGDHDDTCIDIVVEDMHRNAYDAGVWPADAPLLPWETVWGVLVADLVEQWLSDGSATCRCRHVEDAEPVAPVEPVGVHTLDRGSRILVTVEGDRPALATSTEGAQVATVRAVTGSGSLYRHCVVTDLGDVWCNTSDEILPA